MKAVRFIETGKPAQLADVPAPRPGPGQVSIKIAGAGVCHSDLHVLDEELGLKGPFVLGHENAGHIAALGEGVREWREGDAVAVYGPWGCGRCRTCQTSAENYCENHASLATMGGGLGSDGGMAEYMLVPSARLLVALGKLDPVAAAPLSDAALTPYHAIKAALPLLTPDATVVVIGIGGLGHMAVQILQALTPAQLIAADIDDSKLEHARKLGVRHAINTRDADAAAAAIADLAGPRGATAVFDFVGAQATVDLGARIVGRNSRLTVVGLAGGVVHYAANNPQYGCQVTIPYWGSRTELMEVIALAAAGRIRAEVEVFPLEQALDVYQRLRDGKIRGRAVLRP
ncbi:oxidoreductase [Steroidobacter agaridevorans]|uniref:alcohol dehydrogenase n=1 Tax=Steroidobacter agaridevorans TaxID=2695856 RepID=A0A829YA68_9GAMM|nr:NAD(P)-dependent alcohol dehydrogenase [Steroidobacter agaridevorans]GFE80070.1 oxidoreductase [Steroidobacter agaridevorans]